MFTGALVRIIPGFDTRIEGDQIRHGDVMGLVGHESNIFLHGRPLSQSQLDHTRPSASTLHLIIYDAWARAMRQGRRETARPTCSRWSPDYPWRRASE